MFNYDSFWIEKIIKKNPLAIKSISSNKFNFKFILKINLERGWLQILIKD